MAHYAIRLQEAIREKQTPALVGLDPRFDRLPAELRNKAADKTANRLEMQAMAVEEFCRRLVDLVAPLVPAVKPGGAFFEELGPPGCHALSQTILHARRAGLIVILDGKRGDIGSTAEAYARGYLAGSDAEAAPWAADALTVNPYLGPETLEPFLEVAAEREAGLYVLVRTSNPGAGEFQDWPSDSAPLYRHVAETVEQMAERTAEPGGFGCVGAVVGATYPQELRELRELMPHTPLLVPGYGSQGGTAGDIAAAFTADGLGALVNSSRAINFAFAREPYRSRFGPDQWEAAAEAATREMIADLAEHTPAGNLRTG